jgi:hypothetical protein
MPLTIHASLFTPILAELDLGQIVVFVVVAIVAFVQWVIKLIKEKAEAAERSRRVPTPAEEEARRRAWTEQTRTAPPPHANTPTAGGMLEDLLGEFRKALDPTQQSKPPVLPPAVPKVAPAAVPLPLAPRPPQVDTVPVLAHLQSLRMQRKQLHPLTRLLRTPGGYQQAFVLREVLGPPRGLEEYHGPD